jgi:flagellar FliJ protein
MTSTTALTTLLEQAERDRDAAQAELQAALNQHHSAVAQQSHLCQYRDDHRRQWQGKFGQSGAIELVHCYQGYSDRLNHAVDFQQHRVTHAHERVAHCRTLLLEQERRVASIRKLLERRQAETRLMQDRREQKAADEFAARVAWNRTLAASSAGTAF